MEFTRKEFVDTAGIVAVVASLVFVGLQLQQEQLIAQASLGSVTLEELAAFEEGFTDPEVAAIYAKMIEDPNSMTTAEMAQANGLLGQMIHYWIREDYLFELGVFGERSRIFAFYDTLLFGNKYAQVWWDSNKSRFPEYEKLISAAIENTSVTGSIDSFHDIRSKLTK